MTAASAIVDAFRLHDWAATLDAEARDVRDKRDAAIRAALAGGMTQRAVATAVGITPAMVARIAHGGRGSA